MVLFELVILLLFAGALFALWSERLGVPYPALLALVGAVIALVPGAPNVDLDPALALALFVAPTLLDAAYDASPRDLRHNFFAVASLAVVAVLLTVGAVAWVARLAVPDMRWSAAIALGAIVAPPDASAASAVLRKLKPPHRLLVVLEGESLFNDATSLLIYRLAVAAAVTGSFSAWSVAPMFLLTCGGGIVVGWLLARAQVWLTRRVDDIPVNVLLQFVVTFAVWILAERAGLSAILTVVAYAMTIARHVAGRMHARHRIASYAVWEVVVLVLNVLAFVLIGLQLRGIAERVHGEEWRVYATCAGLVCTTVIVVRVAWVMVHTLVGRFRHARFGNQLQTSAPTLGSGVLASWCGMRGIVTLAAALALPDGPTGFPHRDLIIFSAFCVVLATLVVQGVTLRPLMQILALGEDGTVERETAIARAETAHAALRVLIDDPSPAATVLRRQYEARLQQAERPDSSDGADESDRAITDLQLRAVAAQREALTSLRSRHIIGEDALHAVEEELDLLELTADLRLAPAARGAAS